MVDLSELKPIPLKHNALIFVAALTGQIIAAEYFLPLESGASTITALTAVIGFNIGTLLITKISEKPEYDERQYQNIDQGLAWGFLIAVSMLGIDLASRLSWSKAKILIASTSAAVLIMICRNYLQTEGIWKRKIKAMNKKFSRSVKQ